MKLSTGSLQFPWSRLSAKLRNIVRAAACVKLRHLFDCQLHSQNMPATRVVRNGCTRQLDNLTGAMKILDSLSHYTIWHHLGACKSPQQLQVSNIGSAGWTHVAKRKSPHLFVFEAWDFDQSGSSPLFFRGHGHLTKPYPIETDPPTRPPLTLKPRMVNATECCHPSPPSA